MKNLFSIKSVPGVVTLVVLIAFLGCAAPKPATKPAENGKPAGNGEKAAKPAEPAKAEPAKVAEAKPAEPAKPAPPKKVDPKDPRSVIYMDTKGQLAGTGDITKGAASEAVKAGAGWHPAALASALIPKDKYGLVDWAKAVKENIVTPRHSLDPKVEDEPPMDMDVQIEAKSDFVNDVVYPHWIHTYWFSCDGCHEKIFKMAAGQNNMSMAGISEGKWCGRCHGKVAFPLSDCNRCHTQPKKIGTIKKK